MLANDYTDTLGNLSIRRKTHAPPSCVLDCGHPVHGQYFDARAATAGVRAHIISAKKKIYIYIYYWGQAGRQGGWVGVKPFWGCRSGSHESGMALRRVRAS